ncbi:MAG: CD1845 family protein [Candidatus Fimivivens sp.]
MKILLPITLALSILLGVLQFVLVFGSGILSIFPFLFVAGGPMMRMEEGFTQALPILILGYMISPWGLPMIGVWIIEKIACLNYWLKGI